MTPHLHVFNTISPTILSVEAIAAMLTENETLFRQLGPGVPILLAPVPPGLDTTASVRFDEVGVHIGLDIDVTPSCVAHEVMHILLDLEGYPTYEGRHDAGEWASVLLDCEVDRRIDASGFPHGREPHFAAMTSTPLWRIPDADLLRHYVNFGAGPIGERAELDRWLSRVRRHRPAVANIGDQVLAFLRHGAAMRTAAEATTAMVDIAQLLGEHGVDGLVVTHYGSRIEELRREYWSASLQRLLTFAQQGE